MKPLARPDSDHVQAAHGWFELGQIEEAHKELEKIAPDNWSHPEVLKMHLAIFGSVKRWEEVLVTAMLLIQLAPEDPVGWVGRSIALHRLKNTSEARRHLIAVVERFPTHAVMRYHLACFECQLGDLPAAKKWLREAFALDESKKVKRLGSNVQDIAPQRLQVRLIRCQLFHLL